MVLKDAHITYPTYYLSSPCLLQHNASFDHWKQSF
jgi:hypothetical protein